MSSATAAPAAAPAGLISISPEAARKAKELLEQQENPEGLYLRLGVKGGGCSGFTYVLEFDRDVDEKYDRLFELEGVNVVIDRKSLLFLAGTTLDYAGELHVIGSGEGGFVFKNPNAARTCGCGTSFQA